MIDISQRVIDSYPDELVVIDPKTRKIVMANNKVNKSYKDVMGKYCYATFHPERKPGSQCPLKETIDTKTSQQKVQDRIVKGKKRWYSIQTTPILDEKGKLYRVLHITRDITASKNSEIALQESRERYKKLIQNAPLGILAVDTDGNIVDINKTLFQILGSKSQKVTKSINVLKYKPLIKAGISDDFRTCLDKGKIIVAEKEYRTRWGKDVILRYHLTPVKDLEGNILGVEAIVEDCTERKKSEHQMKKMNMNLLTLYDTSSRLQETVDVNVVIDVAIDAFKTVGFDRVRVYLIKNGKLCGIKASHISDEKFKKVALELTNKFPKAYKAITKKEPVILNKHITQYTRLLEKYDVEQSASLPLISKDKVIGIISIDNRFSKKVINRDDLSNLMTFANQIASAIDKSILYVDYQKRVQTLSTLYDVSTALSGTLDLSKILNLIVIRIVKLLKAEVCTVMLVDSDQNLTMETIYDSKEHDKSVIAKVCKNIGMKTIETMSSTYVRDIGKKSSKVKGSALSIPLTIENVPIGVICILTGTVTEYSHQELKLLSSLSHQAAIAIENSQLYQTITNDKDNLSALLEFSQAINSTLDREKLLELILSKAVDFTNAEYGFLMLIEEEHLRVKLSRGYDKKKLDKLRFRIGEGISGSVAKIGEPIIVSDVSLDSRYIPVSDSIVSEAAIPINMHGKVIGVLDLESTRKANFKRFRKSLNILTNQIAVALENVRMYDEIDNFNKRLKQEIYSATRELRKKNIELKKMDQLKSEFVSNVSHELRTPLTSITGYTKLLSLEKLGPINHNQESSLNIIAEESERLTRLINNVLDLSKLEAGKIKFRLEKIDICELAKLTMATMKHAADEKDIELSLESDRIPKFKASRDLVKQVFINLLNNALKFTPENGSIKVIMSREQKNVEVRVIDTGKGIEREQIPKLFDKFYQVDSSMTREFGGTGLGLVIVKHIVDAHKGKISVKSTLGKGAEFKFSLPLRK